MAQIQGNTEQEWVKFNVDSSLNNDAFSVAVNKSDYHYYPDQPVILRYKSKYAIAGIVSSTNCVQGNIILSSDIRSNLGVKDKDSIDIHPAEEVQMCTKATILPYKQSLEKLAKEGINVKDIQYETTIKNYFSSRNKNTHVLKGNSFSIPLDSKQPPNMIRFQIVDVQPHEYASINMRTVIFTNGDPVDENAGMKLVTYDDIGGVDQQLKLIRELIEFPLKFPKAFANMQVPPPKGVLMYGPRGCGKTLIARAIANETNVLMQVVNAPKFLASSADDKQKTLEQIFEIAQEDHPSIIFIDEVESIAMTRDKNPANKDVIALFNLIDELPTDVIILGATNRPDLVDASLRRFARFDHEIEFSVPDEIGRKQIFKIHTGLKNVEDKKLTKEQMDLLNELVKISQGYVGADIAAICTEAAINCIRERINLGKDPNTLEQKDIKFEHYEQAFKTSKGPSSMRDSFVEVPQTKFSHIGGLEDVKKELIKTVEYPLNYPGLFRIFNREPSRGILFYGPPGCGKTLLAKAIASECHANFLSVKGPELLSMWVGESESNVRNIFNKARQASPCIIFFDELDSITSKRGRNNDSGVSDRVINQLLTELDGIESRKSIFVIGATNRPDMIDPAVIRPGRLDQLIYIPLPDQAARLSILKGGDKIPEYYDPSVNLEEIAAKTVNYTGADVSEIVNKATRYAIDSTIEIYKQREQAKLEALKKDEVPPPDDNSPYKIRQEHFDEAFKNTSPSLSPEDIAEYKKIEQKFSKRRGISDSIFDLPKGPKKKDGNNNNNNNKKGPSNDDDNDDIFE